MRLMVVGSGPNHTVDIRWNASSLTTAQLRQAIREQHPGSLTNRSAAFARITGEKLEDGEAYTVSRENIWWLVITPLMGATSPVPDLTQQAKDLHGVTKGKLRINQIKLLLKGEDGLQSRLQKLRHDPPRQAAVLTSVAVRYNMGLQEQKVDTARDMPKEKTEWEIQKNKKKRPDQKQEGTGVTASKRSTTSSITTPQRTLTLKPGTWSQEILSEFALGTDGVYLELSMETARRHAQQLCGTKNNIALITTQALDLFKHQQRATFVLLERTAQGIERDKVVTGFIHSFGKQPVKYLDDTQTLVSKLIPRATVVLRARMRRSTCEKKDWDDMGKFRRFPHGAFL